MSQSLSSLVPSESHLTVRKDQEGVCDQRLHIRKEKKRNHNPQPFFLVHIEIKPFFLSFCGLFGACAQWKHPLFRVSLFHLDPLCLQRLSVVCRKGNAAMISFPVLFLPKTKQKNKPVRKNCFYANYTVWGNPPVTHALCQTLPKQIWDILSV